MTSLTTHSTFTTPHHNQAPCQPLPPAPPPPLLLPLRKSHATTDALSAAPRAMSPIVFAATLSAIKRSTAMVRSVVPTSIQPIGSSLLISAWSAGRGSRGTTKLLERWMVRVMWRWKVEYLGVRAARDASLCLAIARTSVTGDVGRITLTCQ